MLLNCVINDDVESHCFVFDFVYDYEYDFEYMSFAMTLNGQLMKLNIMKLIIPMIGVRDDDDDDDDDDGNNDNNNSRCHNVRLSFGNK